MSKLYQQSLIRAGELIAGREIKPNQLMGSTASRLESRKPEVQTFEHLDHFRAMSKALVLETRKLPCVQ